MRYLSYGVIYCAKTRLTEVLYILELHVKLYIVGIHKEPDSSQQTM
jgi:hypothetical protein